MASGLVAYRFGTTSSALGVGGSDFGPSGIAADFTGCRALRGQSAQRSCGPRCRSSTPSVVGWSSDSSVCPKVEQLSSAAHRQRIRIDRLVCIALSYAIASVPQPQGASRGLRRR